MKKSMLLAMPMLTASPEMKEVAMYKSLAPSISAASKRLGGMPSMAERTIMELYTLTPVGIISAHRLLYRPRDRMFR